MFIEPRPDFSIRHERKSAGLTMACARVIAESCADYADVEESLTLKGISSARLVDSSTIHTVLLASVTIQAATDVKKLTMMLSSHKVAR